MRVLATRSRSAIRPGKTLGLRIAHLNRGSVETIALLKAAWPPALEVADREYLFVQGLEVCPGRLPSHWLPPAPEGEVVSDISMGSACSSDGESDEARQQRWQWCY